jgi:phosphatidate cytidylyltransferase
LTPEATPGPRAHGFLVNLKSRVLTAVVALPALVAALFLGPPTLGWALVAAAVLVGAWEFQGLAHARPLRPMTAAGLVLTTALFMDVGNPGLVKIPLAPLALLVLFVAAVVRGDPREGISAAAAALLGAVYLGALGGTMASLLVLEPVAEGSWRFVLLLATIMVSDTFAFFVGHAVGRRRLAPSISPGKTIEGAMGGLAGGVVGALAVRALGLPDVPLLHAIVLGVAVAGFGIAGDLFESLLKRWAGVKDSGRLFPGHGGMLDRLDSLLFGAPVLYYYFLYVH